MKLIRGLVILLFLSGLLTVLFLVQNGTLNFPWQPERTSLVYSKLVESSETSLLQTAEFHLNLLFPYDFVEEGDIVNWQFLQRSYDSDSEELIRKSSKDFYPDRVVPDKWKYGKLYKLCRESGLDPAGRADNFVVVSTRTKAGFSFNKDTIALTSIPEQIADIETIKVILTLPGPEITAIIIEDRVHEDDGFPEVPMSPAQWSRFISVLSPEIGEIAVREGILDLAEETAQFLLADLFGAAGIEIQRIDFKYE
jgi:hypothetical protein